MRRRLRISSGGNTRCGARSPLHRGRRPHSPARRQPGLNARSRAEMLSGLRDGTTDFGVRAMPRVFIASATAGRGPWWGGKRNATHTATRNIRGNANRLQSTSELAETRGCDHVESEHEGGQNMAVHEKRRRKGRKQGASARHEQLRRHGRTTEGKPAHNRGKAATIRHHGNGKRQTPISANRLCESAICTLIITSTASDTRGSRWRGAASADSEDRACTTALKGKDVSIERAMQFSSFFLSVSHR